MKVTVFSAPNRKGVYHTRDCDVMENRDGHRHEYEKDQVERLGYVECAKCKKEYGTSARSDWRKSLKQMIKDGEVETV